jgi:MoaA/NifB/PqqE/SkfB family radical SAM enzyme
MSYEEIIHHIDQAVDSYPTLKVCVFTGGECFLIGNDLDRCINHATRLGLSVRVVTNGYWADSYENAFERLSSLVDNGLKEINFSTGDEHQEFVKLDNIINGIHAAIDLGIEPPIYIAIESSDASKFKTEQFKSNEFLSKLIENNKVDTLSAAWVALRSGNQISNKNSEENNCKYKNSEGCDNLFRTISINPYSHLLACCGITAEYNKFLKLGDLKKYALKDLYETQFEDIYKLWLHTVGPKHLYETIAKHQGKEPEKFTHICTYCVESIKNDENINAIRETSQSQIPGILFKLESMNLTKY